MNRQLVKNYIDAQPIKIVKTLDLTTNRIEYDKIKQISRVVTDCSDDEEITRAFVLTKLVNELGYLPDRIEIEHEYKSGRPKLTKPRIDIVVRDAEGNAFLFIETKNPDEYAKIDKDETIRDQLYSLAFMDMADGHKVKYLVLYTHAEKTVSIMDECMIIDMEQYPTFADWEVGRSCANDIPARYGKAQHKPYIKDSDKDLESEFSEGMLTQLQVDLHNVLWGGGGTDDNEVFASLTNLILAKIQDEGTTESGEAYKFQSLMYEKAGDEEFETNEQLFERINLLYREALKSKLHILDEKELKKSYVVDSKKFSLSKLKYAVQKLEGLSFVKGKNSLSGKDILGEFFEGIIRSGFKQSKGQFFTPINIVKFMLWGIQADLLAIFRIKNDKEIPYMIDPSAGSGTFLIEYMKFITENMKYRFRSKLGTSIDVIDKIESDWFYPDNRENKWAQTYIYGVESNFNLGTSTKVNMILHGDGSTNIFVKDGLLPFAQYEKEQAPNVLHDSTIDANYDSKDVNGNFDIILTNPPFSVELDNDTKKILKKNYVFGDKKNSENLFIERWYQLLRENGRLAAVLPDNVFDTTENKYIRLFIYKYFKVKAIVSLPQLTFQPYTSTKTSVLFAQKKTKEELKQWNDAWNSASKKYAKLKTRVENLIAVHDGKKEKDKLPSIKTLTDDEERDCLIQLLKDYLLPDDTHLSTDGLIEKYRDELIELCKYDKGTVDSFGYVNTWWVFSEMAALVSNDVFMAEIDNVGYKRTNRGEIEMPNELFTLEYAPQKLDLSRVMQDFSDKIISTVKEIAELEEKKKAEKDNGKIRRLQKRIDGYEEDKRKAEGDMKEIEALLSTYYDKDGILLEKYNERTNEKLINEFKSGRLEKYKSTYVALHQITTEYVLDYMRKISWD